MNRELLAKVRDRIVEVGDEGCDMGWWAGWGNDEEVEFPAIPASGEMCGTTACIAGHAIAIATGSFKMVNRGTGYCDGNGKEVDPAYDAKKLLGIDHSYFGTGGWPKEFLEIYENEGPAKGMLAVVDGLLNGTLDPKTPRRLV